MLWIKALHVAFMVTWFAGLFYLPRLYVYHAMCEDEPGNARFKVMERKLFVLMTMGAVLTAIFGFWMLFSYAWMAYGSSGWLITKLILVTLLVIYHIYCWKLVVDFREDRNRRSHVYYRWFNEAPVLLLLGIVLLAIAKPF